MKGGDDIAMYIGKEFIGIGFYLVTDNLLHGLFKARGARGIDQEAKERETGRVHNGSCQEGIQSYAYRQVSPCEVRPVYMRTVSDSGSAYEQLKHFIDTWVGAIQAQIFGTGGVRLNEQNTLLDASIEKFACGFTGEASSEAILRIHGIADKIRDTDDSAPGPIPINIVKKLQELRVEDIHRRSPIG